MAPSISPVNPISLALNRVGLMLFKPFDFTKWLVLGFCAWLAYMGEGPRLNLNIPFPGGGGGGAGPDEVWNWITGNLHWLIPIAVAFVLLILAIVLVLMWIRCRGNFMFLDGVALNRALVKAPWTEFRAQGNSLFWFNFWLLWAMFFAFLLCSGIGVLIAWSDIKARTFGWPAGIGIAVGILLLFLVILVFTVVTLLLEDFVVPLMYLRRVTVGPAWGEFRHRVAPGHVGVIVLFYLMKIVVGMACWIIMIAGSCITCCIPMYLPFVWAVLFLPILVFNRCYSLYFLEQFGPEYAIFAPEQLRAFEVIMNPPIPAIPLDNPPPPPPPAVS